MSDAEVSENTRNADNRWSWALGWGLLLLPFLLGALMVVLWPTVVKDGQENVESVYSYWTVFDQKPCPVEETCDASSGKCIKSAEKCVPGMSLEARLMILVMIAGAIGHSIMAGRAFAYHHGADKFDARWNWWYLLGFPVGVLLALVLYFVLRGGIFAGSFASQSEAMSSVNPYGFVSLGALAGMFAGHATSKLEEIFKSIFTVKVSEKNGRQTNY